MQRQAILDVPFVLLPRVVFLTQVDEVSHGLRGQKLEAVNYINLQMDTALVQTRANEMGDEEIRGNMISKA